MWPAAVRARTLTGDMDFAPRIDAAALRNNVLQTLDDPLVQAIYQPAAQEACAMIGQ